MTDRRATGPLAPDAAAPPVVSGLGRAMTWRYMQAAATAFTSLFITAFALRRLGPADYGVFALVLSVSGFIALLDFGLGLTVIRASAVEQATTGSDQERARDDVRAANAAYFALGAVSLAVVFLLTLVLPDILPDSASSQGEVRATVLLLGLGIALSLGTSAFNGVAYGRREFGVIPLAVAGGAAVNVLAVVTLLGGLELPSLAIGQLAGVLVGRGSLAIWVARNVRWFSIRPSRPDWASVRRVAASALPLFIITLAGQFIATTDLVVLAAFTTAASVGLYRVGSVVPYQVVSVLYQGYDVVFPSLAATGDLRAQADAARFLSRVAAYLAGVIFGLMAFLRDDVVLLLVGQPEHLAANVLMIFSAVWLVNVSIHGLALFLIARNLQRLLAKLVVIEILMNLFLTLLLVWLLGPVGAAIGSLVAVVISHWLLLPRKVDKVVYAGVGTTMLRHAWTGTVAGLTVIALPCAALALFSPSLGRMLIGGTSVSVIATAVGAMLLRREGRRELVALLRRRTLAAST